MDHGPSNAQRVILIIAVSAGLGYGWLRGAFVGDVGEARVRAQVESDGLERATFAAGCFWRTEAIFEGLPGVRSVTVGYIGGTSPNPTYAQVSTGATGYAEAAEVAFDPDQVSYRQLLDRFWHNVDPFSAHRQFCDVGSQYRPEIFVHDAAQRREAEESRQLVGRRLGHPVVVPVTGATRFFPAEAVHQDYARNYPAQYGFYRWGCGRDARLVAVWADPKS